MPRRRDFYYWRVVATGASFGLFGLGGLMLGYLVLPLVSWCSPSRDTAIRRCRFLVHRTFSLFARFMVAAGVITWDIRGEAALARPGQLVIANHPSLIDIVLLIARIPNATCIVKASLFRNPFTRGPVRRAGYVPSGAPEQLLRDGVRELEKGATLVVFPEGTRSLRDRTRAFRRGAAYLWLASDCPLALVAITVRPPTLAKGEKWYQVPHRRPHFQLSAREHTAAVPAPGERGSASARTVTRAWQQYFLQEISV